MPGEEVTRNNMISISDSKSCEHASRHILTHWIFDDLIVIRNIPWINRFLEWPSIGMIKQRLLKRKMIAIVNFSSVTIPLGHILWCDYP